MAKILLVEDEPSIQAVVEKYLKQAGYDVVTANDGFIALQVYDESIDLICLDLMMPNIDGWEVAETIRKQSNVPILITTALTSEDDQLKGYSYNIDDYITKPYSPKILIEKIKSILNRIQQQNEAIEALETHRKQAKDNQIYIFGTIEIDLNKFYLKIDGHTASISRTEFDLLAYLVRKKGEVCSREDILKTVWSGDTEVDTRIVDTYIKKLRKILGNYADSIKTVFGIGYRFAYDEDNEKTN